MVSTMVVVDSSHQSRLEKRPASRGLPIGDVLCKSVVPEVIIHSTGSRFLSARGEGKVESKQKKGRERWMEIKKKEGRKEREREGEEKENRLL